MFCLSLFLLATLSNLLFAFIFLLLLFYSKLKMAYPYCWTRLDTIPHITWQCPHVWHFEIETHNLKLSHHQLHCSLQGLGLCIQCLATHYLKFQIDQPLTLCLLWMKFPRSFLYYAGNFCYYTGIILYAFQPVLCLKIMLA